MAAFLSARHHPCRFRSFALFTSPLTNLHTCLAVSTSDNLVTLPTLILPASHPLQITAVHTIYALGAVRAIFAIFATSAVLGVHAVIAICAIDTIGTIEAVFAVGTILIAIPRGIPAIDVAVSSRIRAIDVALSNCIHAIGIGTVGLGLGGSYRVNGCRQYMVSYGGGGGGAEAWRIFCHDLSMCKQDQNKMASQETYCSVSCRMSVDCVGM